MLLPVRIEPGATAIQVSCSRQACATWGFLFLHHLNVDDFEHDCRQIIKLQTYLATVNLAKFLLLDFLAFTQ